MVSSMSMPVRRTAGEQADCATTPSLAKEGVSVAPARATPMAYLQELFE
jgi:hypothetical protein